MSLGAPRRLIYSKPSSSTSNYGRPRPRSGEICIIVPDAACEPALRFSTGVRRLSIFLDLSLWRRFALNAIAGRLSADRPTGAIPHQRLDVLHLPLCIAPPRELIKGSSSS